MKEKVNPIKVQQQDYISFLDNVKSEIRKARVQVYRVANRELIRLYWKLGKTITEKQKQLGWGKSVVEQLAKDLQKTFVGRREEERAVRH